MPMPPDELAALIDFSPTDSLSILQLSLFRTELCRLKVTTSQCPEGERCPFSHCLSWHRRNPFVISYRALLCPNTRFWTEAKRMKVKTWCRRGRRCLFAHTKEEQMYHPLVYKTQICRDWPGCQKPFCPFAHGLAELRDPDVCPLDVFEGPEMVELSVRHLVGEDKVKQEFDRYQRERECSIRALEQLKLLLTSGRQRVSVVVFGQSDPTGANELHMGELGNLKLSREVFDQMFAEDAFDFGCQPTELLSDGLIAIPLTGMNFCEGEVGANWE